MMKINTSTISGYAEMTDADKVKALEAMELAEPEDMTKYVARAEYDTVKKHMDEYTSEVANWKKKYTDQLSAEEKAKIDREEADKARDKELAGLKRDKTISELKSQFLSLGYDEELATSTAEAQADSDSITVLANQKKFRDALIEQTKKELLGNTPRPITGGNTNKNITKGQFEAMNLRERTDLYQTNPELYKQLQKE